MSPTPIDASVPAARVLVIDDETQIRRFLDISLRAQGYQVRQAATGQEGLQLAASEDMDLVILDIGLPDMEGHEVLEQLRQWSQVPVIMLTARDELPDKIAGFRAGADDYLTKPFALPELEVRLEALLLRAQGRNPRKRLQVGDLVLDLATLEAQRGGQVLHLYPACRKLLEVLMRASPGAVTRQQLEFALWGDEPPDGDLLRSHVYELRRSVDGPFADKLIHTLPRVGYRLALMDAADAGRNADEGA